MAGVILSTLACAQWLLVARLGAAAAEQRGRHVPVSQGHRLVTPDAALRPWELPLAWDWRSVNGTNWLGVSAS